MSLCHYVLKTTPVFFCHYIILSKNHTYLPLSLCHYVLKKTPVSPRPHVTLSSKPPHLLLPELVHLLPCLPHTLSYPSPPCYSQNLFICYPVSFIPSVHRPYSPVSLPALKILTENIEHLTGLLLTLHVITKNMTIRLICMSFRV